MGLSPTRDNVDTKLLEEVDDLGDTTRSSGASFILDRLALDDTESDEGE